MNINHPDMAYDGPTPSCTPQTWLELFDFRRKTFQGFAEIEEGQGVLVPSIPMHSAKGQDLARLLAFRVLEEAAESYLASEKAHQKEEAIDAINYLMSIALLDEKTIRLERLCDGFAAAAEVFFNMEGRPRRRHIGMTELGQLTLSLAGKMPEGFRNRSWMNQAQDLYFSRVDDLMHALVLSLCELLAPFDSWAEFYHYYRSKDAVLQFRLATRY